MLFIDKLSHNANQYYPWINTSNLKKKKLIFSKPDTKILFLMEFLVILTGIIYYERWISVIKNMKMYLSIPLHGWDVTQGQFLSRV